MKVLYFTDILDISLPNILLKEKLNFHTELEYEKALELFDNNDYDVVIVDFSFEKGQKFLNYIETTKPTQKLITVSEVLEYSELEGCDYCINNYNKRRLLKPLSTQILVRYIVDFENQICKYKNKFLTSEGIVEILGDILSSYANIQYNKETQIINYNSSRELIEVTEMLKKYNISYLVDIDTNAITVTG